MKKNASSLKSYKKLQGKKSKLIAHTTLRQLLKQSAQCLPRERFQIDVVRNGAIIQLSRMEDVETYCFDLHRLYQKKGKKFLYPFQTLVPASMGIDPLLTSLWYHYASNQDLNQKIHYKRYGLILLGDKQMKKTRKDSFQKSMEVKCGTFTEKGYLLEKAITLRSYLVQKTDSDGDITTGFNELDTALGPLPKGELTTFAARSGFGKTTFGCTLAEYWRSRGKKVLFFSTEMHRDYILHKMVSLHCGIPLAHTIRKEFTAEEITRIKQYEQELLQSPVTIVDTFQPTLQQVQAEILKCKPDILIFDHITQSGTHWEHIAQFARGLKDVTTQENIVTVLLSMLNEPPRKQDGSVSTSVRGDVRGSQEIVFLSAIFCLLSNPYEIKGRFQPVDVLVAKNRYGISNQIVPLSCDKVISKFIERNKSHESDEV
jgi:KaiC/GvpD/RAD55 family RecA-like ATPase